MVMVDGAIVEDGVYRASFCCDLQMCKGACCCIAGGRGAPLLDDEVLEISRAYPSVRRYLGQESIRTIERLGLVEGIPGDYATTCIEDRECVFVYFDDGIARCGFERAYQEGMTGWRKPLSCHLFPIRIRGFGRDVVRYEQIDECAPGRARGTAERVALVKFLREPLIRRFGNEWYEHLLAVTAPPEEREREG